MRSRMICLAGLVLLAGAASVAAAEPMAPGQRSKQTRRWPQLYLRRSGQGAGSLGIFTPDWLAPPIDRPSRKEASIKAKRELLKMAISFERYRIAQRKFPLKRHDQVELLAVRLSDATWSAKVAYSERLICAAVVCRA